MRRQLFPKRLAVRGRLILQLGNEIRAQVAGVKDRRLLIETVEMAHHLQAQGVLILPVLVDGGFADTRRLGDGIHTGSIDAPL